MKSTLPTCAACGSDLQGNAFCEECGARAGGAWQPGDDPQPGGDPQPAALATASSPAATPSPPPPADEPEQEGRVWRILDAVDSGVSKVMLVVLGLGYTAAAILCIFILEFNWVVLVLLAYGIYLLSGLVTGGSRWLIY